MLGNEDSRTIMSLTCFFWLLETNSTQAQVKKDQKKCASSSVTKLRKRGIFEKVVRFRTPQNIKKKQFYPHCNYVRFVLAKVSKIL